MALRENRRFDNYRKLNITNYTEKVLQDRPQDYAISHYGMKKLIKKFVPEFALNTYHWVRGFHAATKNAYPAHNMIVVGVTGTKGKTSTANYIWSVLTAGGYKTGLITSANFRIGNEEEINSFHMTMPNPYIIQKKIREMQAKNVSIVVIEMTSEGMKQYRHFGIPVDIAVFTNLTPEHLGSHKNNFELYKKAKGALFEALASKQKMLFGKTIPKAIIANADSPHADYYLSFPADQKITFGLEHGTVQALGIASEKNGTSFTTSGTRFSLSVPGIFNVYNALPAIIIGNLLDVPLAKIAAGLQSLTVIPGRMELIDIGQSFPVYVDYAHEPSSFESLLHAAQSLRKPNGKTIILMGVIGGGRESRVPLARLAATMADYVIITNEDPYDSDPEKMIAELRDVAEKNGKELNKNLFAILDRREAIRKALSLASADDIVVISGKGAETTMMTKSGAIPWNERAIVRELVTEILQK